MPCTRHDGVIPGRDGHTPQAGTVGPGMYWGVEIRPERALCCRERGADHLTGSWFPEAPRSGAVKR